MRRALTILLIMSIISCEKPVPVSQPEPPAPEVHDPLPIAQLAHAKTHLENSSPGKAIPYLIAASEDLPEASELLAKIRKDTSFPLPILHLTHPSTITRHLLRKNSLWVALEGELPTVLRWDLNEPSAPAAILFPSTDPSIGSIILSPNSQFIAISRGESLLLCDAVSLQPIAGLGTFPKLLAAEDTVTFSANSLLLAHPVSQPGEQHIWHIRDTVSSEIIRSASLPLYPRVIRSRLSTEGLHLLREDDSVLFVPLVPEIEISLSPTMPAPNLQIISDSNILPVIEGETIILSRLVHGSEADDHDSLLALSRHRLDPSTQSLVSTTDSETLAILSEKIPGIPSATTQADATDALLVRFSAAFPERFPEITLSGRTDAEIVRATFASGNNQAIPAVIAAAGTKGLALSTALFQALQNPEPLWISQVLQQAENLPPALLSISLARLSQLDPKNHPPAPDALPDLASERAAQDWYGWEVPDFSPILLIIQSQLSEQLTSLDLPPDPNEADLQIILSNFLNPEAVHALGPQRLAQAAFIAANDLSQNQKHATSSLQFAAIALRYGMHPAPVLRVQATAFATLGDFENAHRCWLDLITHQPEVLHLPADYSEAAHSAFENQDPRQAIAILETGIHRFPRDAELATRAGWIAILSHHPSHAITFLSRADSLGPPPAEQENVLALLASSSSDLGDDEAANHFFSRLVELNPSWQDPHFIAELAWPESITQSLHLLSSISIPVPDFLFELPED